MELGRAARAESAVKIRQPLSQALIAASGWTQLPNEMKEQIAEELNVLTLQDISTAGEDLVHVKVKANFRTLGAKYGKSVQEIAQLISNVDPLRLVTALRKDGKYDLISDETTWSLDIDDLAITEEPKVGWTVATHDSESVALDLTLTAELIEAGSVREVVRAIQESRKSEGFDISDRIAIRWNATNEVAQAVSSHLEKIKSEVLALEVTRDIGLDFKDSDLGFVAKLSIARKV